MSSVLNFNIGVLGHIDSGKTSLAKALSSIASTACFDKNPQSQERGITIDLGFSSFCVDYPEHLKSECVDYHVLQYTLVDCPGHASLIRTIIGGAQIIDMMLLVVDITKGIQTQTAECLVIGEITCNHMLVVLNKIDLVDCEKRSNVIAKVSKKISKTLEKTKFANAQIVPVAANPSGDAPMGIEELVKTLIHLSYLPPRTTKGPFIFAVDHCFAVRGQGTVMTGTVIQGSVTVSDTVEIPMAKISRKVKSIQMFKKNVESAKQGDRVGICVTQFDPKLLERGAVCSPGHMSFVEAIITQVNKISYFKGTCATNSKFHISIMHDTVMAKCSFFASTDNSAPHCNSEFDYDKEYEYLNELECGNKSTLNSSDENESKVQYALLQFEKPVIFSPKCTLIGSKLDMDIHSNICRLAFHGIADVLFSSKQQLEATLPKLKVYKNKMKEGIVDRMNNEHEIIGKEIFRKETNMKPFINLKVTLSTSETGFIESSFGQSGKVKIRIPNGLSAEAVKQLSKKKGKGDVSVVDASSEPIKIALCFKRYIYDPQKKIIQT